MFQKQKEARWLEWREGGRMLEDEVREGRKAPRSHRLCKSWRELGFLFRETWEATKGF